MAWAAPAIVTNLSRLGEIHVPVLLSIGAQDQIWTQDGWAQQKDHFTGSHDVTAVPIPNAGHFPMLERVAPQLRALVATWLSRRGFGAPGGARFVGARGRKSGSPTTHPGNHESPA